MNPTRLLRSFFRPAACLALGFVAALVATPGAHAALGVCDQGNLVDVEASGGTTPLAAYEGNPAHAFQRMRERTPEPSASRSAGIPMKAMRPRR